MIFKPKKAIGLLFALSLITSFLLIPAHAATYSYQIDYIIYGDVSMRHAQFAHFTNNLDLVNNPTNAQVLAAARGYIESSGQAPAGQIFDPSDSYASQMNAYTYQVRLSYYGTNIQVLYQAQTLRNGSSYDNYGSTSSSPIITFSNVKANSVSSNSGYYFNAALSMAPQSFLSGNITYVLNAANSQLSWGVNCGGNGYATICLLAAYDPKVTVSYQYNGTIPPGVSAPSSSTAIVGSKVTAASVPTVPGYTFSGWTTTSSGVYLSGGSFTVPSNNVTFTGTWTANIDTPYSVEFYKQSLTDNSYTKQSADSISGKGTTDTQIRAALDMTALSTKYPHYHLTDASKTDTTVIGGNGTSVLKLYYDLDTANVTYVYSGTIPKKAPATPAATAQKYGATVHVATAPTLSGYDFSGWASGNTNISSGMFTMLDQDVTISGKWTPRTDTPFTVEYYQQNIADDNYTLADTEHCIGTTDTVAIVPEKTYSGFTMTPESMTTLTTTNIDGDGKTLLKLYYDRNVNTVTYSYSGETDVEPPELPAVASYRYGQTVAVDAGSPTLPGYEFGGWETSDVEVSEGQFIMPDSPVTLTGNWTPRTDTPFTVEYYQQNFADDGYTLTYTFNGEGTTGANVPHKEFEGYTEVPDSVTAEGSFEIKSDGTGILKLYFDRAICSVTYAYAGETDVTPPTLPETANYRYGQTVSVDAGVPVLQGYDFSGWKSADVEVTDAQFSMPDKPVTFTGTWKARSDVPYTVGFYQQNIECDGYTLADTFNGEGTAGGNIPLKEFEGFLLTPDSVTAAGNFKIRSDGTATLKLYYDRERFTVTYAYTGRSAGDTVPEDAPELPATASYRYGQTVTLPAQPQSKSTLRFLGWALDGTLTNALDFALKKDVAITGYWYTPTYSDGGGDNDKAAYSAVLIPDSTATDIVLQSDSSNRVTFLAPPEKEGCTFAGWATESGGDATYHAGDTITLTRNCVFYAVYYRQIAPYIIGFTDNTFRPGSNLTLKQGALMLKRLGVSTQITSSNLYFTRRVFLSLICSATGADTRSQDPMALAVEKGWIIGFTDGTLRSDDYITRAQATTILDRVFRQGDTQAKDGRSFADIPQTHWASDAILRASTTSTIRV